MLQKLCIGQELCIISGLVSLDGCLLNKILILFVLFFSELKGSRKNRKFSNKIRKALIKGFSSNRV